MKPVKAVKISITSIEKEITDIVSDIESCESYLDWKDDKELLESLKRNIKKQYKRLLKLEGARKELDHLTRSTLFNQFD